MGRDITFNQGRVSCCQVPLTKRPRHQLSQQLRQIVDMDGFVQLLTIFILTRKCNFAKAPWEFMANLAMNNWPVEVSQQILPACATVIYYRICSCQEVNEWVVPAMVLQVGGPNTACSEWRFPNVYLCTVSINEIKLTWSLYEYNVSYITALASIFPVPLGA